MRAFLPILLLLIAGVFITFWSGCGASGDRPNIVLITLDTTRLDHMSCYGYHRRTTPRLDRLAKEGQLYDKSVAVSSWTLPTHASLFTGLFPTTHGAHYATEGNTNLSQGVDVGRMELYGTFKADGLSEESITLAEILKAEGYATGGIGAGPWLKPTFGLAQGFDYFDCDVLSVQGRQADEITVLGNKFIRKHRDEPFFLFLNYFDPHSPYNPPKELKSRFVGDLTLEQIQSDEESLAQYYLSMYDSEILFMDREIGRLFDELKKLELYDDTWIIVISDHGELLGDHGLKGHGQTLYEPSIRAPMIIKWPKGWQNLPDTNKPCQQVDIMPTIAERLNMGANLKFEGQPLGKVTHPPVAELFRNPGFVDTKGPRFDRDLRAIYAGPFKLITSSKEQDPDAGLFDVQNDPGELNDLSEEKPDILKNMQTLLDQWKESLQNALPPRDIENVDPETLEQLEKLGYGTK